MKRFQVALDLAQSDAVRSLDLSMFHTGDVLSVALQRSEVLTDIPERNEALRSWVRGDEGPLLQICHDHGVDLVRRAIGFTTLEYRALRPLLQRLGPQKVADIGCSYGFFDLFAYAELGCDLVLIDTEDSAGHNLKFGSESTGYSSLSKARQFLLANGCAAASVTAVNPHEQDLLAQTGIDLAVSFNSCGVHYPCDMYLDFFQSSVVPGGSVILDIRSRRSHEILPGLAGLGKLTKIGETPDGKALRMQLVTTSAPARNAA
ncbi:MAG: class I SAM-dependent methyltransferase [Rhodobacter sp.]|nr:class I SAM-dependent methyltransferase [Rhodobacter sp.]